MPAPPPYGTIKNARWRGPARTGMLWLTNANTDQENTMHNTPMPAAPGPARTRRRGLL